MDRTKVLFYCEPCRQGLTFDQVEEHTRNGSHPLIQVDTKAARIKEQIQKAEEAIKLQTGKINEALTSRKRARDDTQKKINDLQAQLEKTKEEIGKEEEAHTALEGKANRLREFLAVDDPVALINHTSEVNALLGIERRPLITERPAESLPPKPSAVANPKPGRSALPFADEDERPQEPQRNVGTGASEGEPPLKRHKPAPGAPGQRVVRVLEEGEIQHPQPIPARNYAGAQPTEFPLPKDLENNKTRSPYNLCVDDEDQIIVAENDQSRISKFSPAGAHHWFYKDQWPESVAFHPQKKQVYLRSQDFIISLSHEGTAKEKIPAPGTPTGICISPSGEIFYTAKKQLQVLKGEPLGGDKLPDDIQSLAFHPGSGHILVTSSRQGVLRLSPAGRIISCFGKEVLKDPYGICVDRDGQILVSNSGARCVTVFNEKGELVTQFGERSLERPLGICINSKGKVLVAEESRILTF